MNNSLNPCATNGSLNIFSQVPSFNNSLASNPCTTASTRADDTLLHPETKPLRCRASRSQQQSPASTTPAYVYALDHLSTKLKIPLSAIEVTNALVSDGLVPGICRLHMDGQCRQGARCFQIHADPGVLNVLRKEAHENPSCCHVHGAKCSYVGFPLALTVTLEGARDPLPCSAITPSLGSQVHASSLPQSCQPQDTAVSATAVPPSPMPSRHAPQSQSLSMKEGDTYSVVTAHETSVASSDPQTNGSCSMKPSVIPLSHLNPTSFLWKLYREEGRPHLRVPISRVCRDHRKGLCRFGEECSFLHVCRELPLDHYHGLDDAIGAPSSSLSVRGHPASRWLSSGAGSSSMPLTGNCPGRPTVNGSFSSCNYPPGQSSFIANSLSSSMTSLRVGGQGNTRSYGTSVPAEEVSLSRAPLLRPLAQDSHHRHRHHTSGRSSATNKSQHNSLSYH